MNLFTIRPQTRAADQSLAGSPIAAQPKFARRLGISKNARTSAAVPITLLTFTAVLTAALPAHADVQKGQFEVSPFAGYHRFESDQNLKSGLTYGLRLGYSITPHWAIEGAVSTVNSSVDDASIVDASEGQFTSPADDVDLMLYQVDALYHFRPNNKFSPYVVGGYGAADYSPSISTKDMSTFNVGVGAKYWMADTLALRFEVRDHLVGEVFDHSYNNISATLGVSFAFGGKASSTAYQAATPEPEKAVHVEAPEAEAEVVILEFEDIHFDFDESALTGDAERILQRSITTLQDNPNSRVRIAGYTSAAGTEEHNQALSEKRAQAIRTYLVKDGGIAETRLSVIGYGSKRPAAHEESPANVHSTAAKENMRALFEIVVE